jgi:hypothetical protein
MLSRDQAADLIRIGTGTDAGIHRDINAATCGRRAHLDAVVGGEEGFSEDRDVGTVGHALLARYHTGQDIDIPRPDLAADWDISDPLYNILREAWRMFDFYSGVVAPDGWGRVLAAEQLLVGQLPDGTRKTGQADLVVEIPQGAHDTPVFLRTGLPLSGGVYLVDHKFKTRKDSNVHLRYAFDLQPKLYQYLYEKTTGVRPAGFIINMLVRHKKLTPDSMVAILVDPPTDEEIEQLTRFVNLAGRRRLEAAPNLAACFNYGRACPHLLSGACDRK